MKFEWWQSEYGGFNQWIIIDRLADVIMSHVDGCIVEIGIGHSTPILAKHARDFGVKHYAIDSKGQKCRWAKTCEETAGDNLIIYYGQSLDFLKDFEDTPAIVLIDGCHRYNTVKKEVAILLPKIPEGGVMFLHDTCACEDRAKKYIKKGKTTDCYKIRLDLEKDKSVWCITFPYTAFGYGLTLALKRPKFEYSCDYLKG